MNNLNLTEFLLFFSYILTQKEISEMIKDMAKRRRYFT